ncbi:MAG: hypothetical protein ACM3SR_08215 [Ignavibacteriales bacterium]
MALYQAAFKREDGSLENHIVKASNTEEAFKKFVESWKLKGIESVKWLLDEDDPEEVIKELENQLAALFLKLHHLAYAGYTVSNELTNGNEFHRKSSQWEIRALMDAIKERSEEIYSLLDALIDIQEGEILER